MALKEASSSLNANGAAEPIPTNKKSKTEKHTSLIPAMVQSLYGVSRNFRGLYRN